MPRQPKQCLNKYSISLSLLVMSPRWFLMKLVDRKPRVCKSASKQKGVTLKNQNYMVSLIYLRHSCWCIIPYVFWSVFTFSPNCGKLSLVAEAKLLTATASKVAALLLAPYGHVISKNKFSLRR